MSIADKNDSDIFSAFRRYFFYIIDCLVSTILKLQNIILCIISCIKPLNVNIIVCDLPVFPIPDTQKDFFPQGPRNIFVIENQE